MERLGLDWVWWLVSPGNPLKTRRAGAAGAADRGGAGAAATTRASRSRTSRRGSGRATRPRRWRGSSALYPDVRFVWLMGSDNLAQLHRWRDWRRIMERVPVAVMARPGQRLSRPLRSGRAAPTGGRSSTRATRGRWRGAEPPAWVVLNLPLMPLSSSAIRAAGRLAAMTSRSLERSGRAGALRRPGPGLASAAEADAGGRA